MRRYRAIARRQWLSIGIVAVVALLHCVLLASLRLPEPWVPDEFSKLLAAETFASGRLTNPAHPMWPYLESMHVIQQPTYQSKYPPADSLLLAFGLRVAGHPLFGVWVGLAVACGALAWMLRAWVGPSWAFAGGLLAASHTSLAAWFGASYLGGSVAMLGGALLFGSLRRIIDDPRPGDAVALAVGVALLANSRPYEGLITSLPAAAVLLVWLMRERRFPSRVLATRVVLPMVSLLALAGLLMGTYHYAVVGDPLRMPYLVYRAASDEFQFAFGRASFAAETDAVSTGARAVGTGFSMLAGIMFGNLWLLVNHLTLGTVLAVPILLCVARMVRQRWVAFAILTFCLTLLAVCSSLGAAPRYLAPVYSLFFLLVVQSLRHVRVGVRRRTRLRAALAGCFIAFWGAQFVAGALLYRVQSFDEAKWTISRAKLVEPLEHDGDRHLVLVRKVPGERLIANWVHNAADIDAAKIVWAWDVDGTPRLPLLRYFDDRRQWLLDLRAEPLALTELPAGEKRPWSLRQQDRAVARLVWPQDGSGAVKAEIEQGGTEIWHLQVEGRHPPVREGMAYTIRFRARADGPRQVAVHVSQAHPPWQNLGIYRRIDVTREWRDFELAFVANRNDDLARLAFDVGGETVSVELQANRRSSPRLPDPSTSSPIGAGKDAKPQPSREGKR